MTRKSVLHICLLLFLTMVFSPVSALRYDDDGERYDLETEDNAGDDVVSDARSVDSLLAYAYKFRGRPYHLGANGPMSFDCSGFTSYVFAHFGYRLSRVSSSQTNHGVAVSKSNVRPGDLVFFKGRSTRSRRIGHVGIASKINPDGSFSFIHAATSQGVTESSINESYYAARYVTARRLIGPMMKNAEPTPDIDASFVDNSSSQQVEEQVVTRVVSAKKKHVVKNGETLSSIAKKYGCTISQLKKWNNLRSTRINKGQRLTVSVKTTEKVVVKTVPKTTAETASADTQSASSGKYAKELAELENTDEDGFHTVKKGETLYYLAMHYGCKVDDLKKWNDLKSPSITAGQKLRVAAEGKKEGKAEKPEASSDETPESIVVGKGETLYSISRKYGMSVVELMELNSLESSSIHYGDVLKLK
ncbi:MAG: LysM peptidoglycan-binding domain-containing protein [Paludibacteraceae bacterium]|nr:LysM peptidoglycan-binding domain-containing protein [Paludibacteraceae bacterium]